MLCSPILRPERTTIPGPLRQLAGRWLSGPPRPARRPRQARWGLYAVGRIGDFVMKLTVLRRLIREAGPAGCFLVVPANCVGLAERELPGVPLLALPPDGAGLLRDIVPTWRRQRAQFADWHCDQRISLRHQRSLYHEVTLSWMHAERDLRLYPADYPAVAPSGLSTELAAHGRILERALGRPVAPEDFLPRFESYPAGDDGRLVVYPLSTQPQRCLSPAWVARVLAAWRSRCPAPIVLGGSPGDEDRLEAYRQAARVVGIEHLTLELPAGVDGFIRHIAAAGAVFATESAAAHIATTLDKPAVIALGGGIHGLCFPWRRSDRQRTIQNHLPCFGCDWHCSQSEMYCLTGLSAEAAATALPDL